MILRLSYGTNVLWCRYEGYLFLQSKSKATVNIALLCTSLGDIGDPTTWKTLGSAELTAPGGNLSSGVPGLGQGWSMLNFTITPTADCLHSGSGPAAGQGLISISLVDGSDVAVDKVMVEPGTWGRESSVVFCLPSRTSRCLAEAGALHLLCRLRRHARPKGSR